MFFFNYLYWVWSMSEKACYVNNSYAVYLETIILLNGKVVTSSLVIKHCSRGLQ